MTSIATWLGRLGAMFLSGNSSHLSGPRCLKLKKMVQTRQTSPGEWLVFFGPRSACEQFHLPGGNVREILQPLGNDHAALSQSLDANDADGLWAHKLNEFLDGFYVSLC